MIKWLIWQMMTKDHMMKVIEKNQAAKKFVVPLFFFFLFVYVDFINISFSFSVFFHFIIIIFLSVSHALSLSLTHSFLLLYLYKTNLAVLKNIYCLLQITLVDMSSESVGLLSSPDRSTSPSLTDPIVIDCCTTTTTTTQILPDHTGVHPQQVRSPGKRQLTIEESLTTTNDHKRLCNRY